VAIKVLPEQPARDRDALERFQREAMAVAALAHPNILVLFDVGAELDVQYAVTELLEGETLRACLDRGALPWRKAAEIGAAIAEGLAAAHARGITHRDIKPANVFLTSDGRVKILDFGLAVQKPSLGPEDKTATHVLPTHLLDDAGTVSGTVGYMPPEQLRGETTGPASDIFSLGCVLYEMVAGRRAFAGKSTTETIAAVLREDPPAIADAGKPSSPELERIIERCLAKNPAHRFHSAHDLAFALRSLSSSSSVPVARATPVRAARRWIGAAIAVVLLIAAAAGFFFWRSRGGGIIDSLAVLPFVNGGGGEEADWLGDGITESLITGLAHVPGVKVMSRNAVARYKGKETDAREAAGQLSVRAIVTGRVAARGTQLSVTAELVDARDGSELWGETYDRPASEIINVEKEISARVSEKLRPAMTGEEKQRVATKGTANPQAYQLYLKGKYFAGKFTKEGFDKGMQYLRQAVAEDPNYASGWEGISYAYQVADDAFVPPSEALPLAREAALKAIALDDSLSEGHTDLANVYFWNDYDFPAAKKEFQRAIELNPKSSFAHEDYGWLLVTMGDAEGGIAEGRKSLEVDPLSVEAAVVLAQNYYLLRRYPDALELIRKAIDQDPGYPLAYWFSGAVDLVQGKNKEAIAALTKGREVGGTDWLVEALAAAYAADGDRAMAQKILNELDERSRHGGYVPQYYLSYAYLALKDRERALAALEKDYQQRSPNMTYIKLDPALDALHNEPRYHALLKKMNLE
jgi:TolB-like protein/tetratricopeptide (TPR) repeat protein